MKSSVTRSLIIVALIAFAGLFLTNLIWAQVGGQYDLSWSTIDGGGATFSTGGNYSLGGTIGQPDAGDVITGGNYILESGFWHCFRPPVVSDVSISAPNAIDARLDWTLGGTQNVYSSTAPYFQITDPQAAQIGSNVTSPFTATGSLGNPAANFYFLVVGENDCGSGAPSNRTGEFDFAITPGS